MERGICPIAVLCFAVKRFLLRFKNFCWSTRVPMLPHFGSRDIIGHMTVRSATAVINTYLHKLYRYTAKPGCSHIQLNKIPVDFSKLPEEILRKLFQHHLFPIHKLFDLVITFVRMFNNPQNETRIQANSVNHDI